ncbi:arylamine N-acetyltransferase family protein [Chitinimonas sp. BJB300]|uniref:arylamine N-acetyltransferase family protein n=1 Tax=Chitinimonas sp. BJB300 TaxID=1559339 RepID=UPI000C0E12DF|nr:arylamine N-acetyltransferase [Chitinimonas sp. BJB300]PHV10881.1 acetyltransferase [Chitinimonas sp. BJB300]TSJ91305.1 arylamine N-acetyltransferase [Chitinimonas sp. BJB300]
MHANNFSLEHYFNRIGFTGDIKTDIHTVTEIMRCQLFSVPFENLDVQAKKTISLVPEEIVEKIIHRNRGGYCYEVNGVFSLALQAMGIPYQFVAARPILTFAQRPKTHMAIVIQTDGESWLCDLGFGSMGIRAPIALDMLGSEIKQDYDTFKLSKINTHDYLLSAYVEDEWINQYSFNLSPQEWIDFEPANYFYSTHPESLFVQKLVAVLHNKNGRIILFENRLKTILKGSVEKQTISPSDYDLVLRDHFNLAMPK